MLSCIIFVVPIQLLGGHIVLERLKDCRNGERRELGQTLSWILNHQST
jgi:hypothetical protein